MDSEKLLEYKNQVVEGAKTIYRDGLVQFGEGNVSIRIKKTDEFVITPSQNDYSRITVDDIVHMKMDGTQLSSGRPSSSEYKLHVAIYEARKKVNCVIHTHSPYAGMLSTCGIEIPPIFEEMLIFLGGPVKVARYAPSGSDELGSNALDAMGNTNCCILTNHAVVACGRDLQKTIKTVNLVEKMAKIYWGALQLGKEIKTIPEEQQEKFISYFKGLYSTAPRKKK
ncbi:MAG: class II aldolase/adducin family protein [Promethearchaeota archaeon]